MSFRTRHLCSGSGLAVAIGHPKAKRAYAWQYEEGKETKAVTVLEIPPADSPQTAVKVAIAAKARQK